MTGTWKLVVVLVLALFAGCEASSGSSACGIEPYHPEAYGSCGPPMIDLLVVVDNSGTMTDEQELLATSLFPLIGSFTDPLPGWGYPPIDDLRIAVVTTDMGFQWDGNPYQHGDGWPSSDLPEGCGSVGDDGEFQTYGSGMTVDLLDDTIPCDASGGQCPTGWSCEDIGQDGIGRCAAPGGDGTGQQCPDLASTFVENPINDGDGDEPNPDLALQAACMSSVGNDGCALEQGLAAAVRAFDTSAGSHFIRHSAQLAVLFVSDESDCSVEDGPAFFGDPAWDEQVNQCALLSDHLFGVGHILERLRAVKGGGDEQLHVLAVIGVPPGEQCEGAGDEIDGCLDLPEMGLPEYIPDYGWHSPIACTREAPLPDGGVNEITRAWPGRRFVELAQAQKANGRVASICNPDWTPAVQGLAASIADKVAFGACVAEPLPWDPERQISECDLMVEYIGGTTCPFVLEPGKKPVLEPLEEPLGDVDTVLMCPLPHIPTPLPCEEILASGLYRSQVPGWIYCEEQREDFNDACSETGGFAGHDEDGDGLTDCDDPQCQVCEVCGGDGIGCASRCRHGIFLTEGAIPYARGHWVRLYCYPPEFEADPQCGS